MGKIVLLDDLTINQIAAGEVIERPASVVKELVENSIDAGAKNISVDIKNGGISYIRVTDDGSGIELDDMDIAFERHATSKIRQADDLKRVKSMGFRGEALASIVSIAKVEVLSKTAEADVGFKIELQGGDVLDKHEEAVQKGTAITVQELFYNTPVRYKFLKKDFTEAGYIEDVITRIALSNPDVALKLTNTGKTVIQTNGNGKLEDVIYEIYGREIYDNLLPVDYTYEGYHVTGAIGKPLISRSNRAHQIFFINKRHVKDKTLTSAADQGFKGLVTVGKHGFLILNIDMDPSKVDVNVHPTKLEVRFQEDSKVFKAVYHAIKETLLKSDLVADPVKDYTERTPGEILKGITNKERTEAWDITKNAKNVENFDSKPKEDSKKPEFNEFRDTISGLDNETRKNFIDEITKAETPEEIVKGMGIFSNLLKKHKKKDDFDYIDENLETEEIKTEEIKTDKETLDIPKKVEDELEKYEPQDENEIEIKVNGEKLEDENKIEIKVNGEKLEDENKTEGIELTNDSKLVAEVNKAINQMKAEKKIEDSNIDETNNDYTGEIDKNNNEDTTETEKPKEVLNENLSFEEMYKKLFGRDLEEAKKEYNEKVKEYELNNPMHEISNNTISLFDKDGVDKNPQYHFIGIAFKTYIILTKDNELYLMDQHAAHERIMYEKVKANYNNNQEKDSQLMLLPDVIDLTTKEMGIYKDNKVMFEKAGFIIEEFGENTVKITGVPSFCLDFDNKEIFLETLDEIDTVARTAKQELEDKFLATVACKAAVKAHMSLSREEVDSIIQNLLKLPNPYSCPHGRPTIIKMSKTDIEKKFSRRL